MQGPLRGSDIPSFLRNVRGAHLRTYDKPMDLRYWSNMQSIDPEGTQLHDDAIGWHRFPSDQGAIIMVAVTADYSRRSQLAQVNTHKLHVNAGGARKNSSLGRGEKEAIVTEFWTDGSSIGDISIYRAVVRPRRTSISPEYGTDMDLRELQEAIGAHNIEFAVQRAMHAHQTITAEFSRRLGAPAPFYNLRRNARGAHPYLTPEPERHDQLGVVPLKSTTPLRSRLSNITDMHVLGLLGGRKPLTGGQIRQVCAYYNNRPGFRLPHAA